MAEQQTSTPATNNLPGDQALENAIEEICRFVAKSKQGKQTEDQIQKRLTDAGLGSDDAHTVTQIGLARIGKDRRAGLRNLRFGALWFVGGSVVALVMRGAGASGGAYLLAYGAILVGFLQLLFGLIQLVRAPRGRAEIRDMVERVAPTVKAEESSRWKIAAIRIHNP